ncbi:calcium-binding protein [Rubrimonas cliftonensis]|uniref:calcium-binding protein n=1 Tax=Rubrimonas cliftonensis TaxID=89524 RepID=UPI0015877F63|nr:calcium-binding protein [Rubrimonas cliftonensis]
MATFTLPVLAIRFQDETETVTAFANRTLELQGPADAAFSYQVLFTEESGVQVVEITSDTTSERFVGVDDNDGPEEELIVRIIRSNGLSHTLLSLYDEETNFDNFVLLGGDPLPAIANAAEAQAFVNSITDFQPVTSGPFGPGVSIPLSGLPGVVIDGETPPITEQPGSIVVEIPDLGELTVAGATEGPDLLIGTPGPDTIDALGGNDTVRGLDSDDDIALGDGDDSVVSDAGNDTIRGGAGDDTIKSGDGDDLIDAGDGADIVLSGDGNDTILGGDGDDILKPGRGDDVMDGGAGDDILVGFRGDEVLVGGAGNDTLLGNLDDDTITGGAGDDRLQGGPGRDVFVFDTPEWGDDRIVLDFLPQSDTLDFRGSGLTLADLSITQAGGNVLIEAGDSSILVNSQRFGALDVADFAGDVLLFG